MEPDELHGKEYLAWAKNNMAWVKTHPDEHNAKIREQGDELEKDSQLDALGNKALEGLLEANGRTTETVKLFGKVDVNVYTTMDGETEKMAIRVYQESLKLQDGQGGDYMMVIKEMCDVCAKMCVDDPFNTPRLWEEYYEQKGSANLMDIMYTFMEPHERSIENIKSFREERRGKKSR